MNLLGVFHWEKTKTKIFEQPNNQKLKNPNKLFNWIDYWEFIREENILTSIMGKAMINRSSRLRMQCFQLPLIRRRASRHYYRIAMFLLAQGMALCRPRGSTTRFTTPSYSHRCRPGLRDASASQALWISDQRSLYQRGTRRGRPKFPPYHL